MPSIMHPQTLLCYEMNGKPLPLNQGHCMSWGRDRDRDEEMGQGLKALLRSLLPGIPWAERAETKETRVLPAPKSQVFKVRNLNGVTRITGEDRDDIEVTALKSARAESCEAAEEMLEEIRLAF